MKTAQIIKAKEYSHFLSESGIYFTVNGSFLKSGEPNFDGRWLICLSICLRDTEQILAYVLPVLKEYGVPFLLIKDQLQHNRINCHAFPKQLFGKPLIVFPEDAQQATRLAEDLIAVTNAFEGVVLPGCIRLGSIVYAVYARLNSGYKEDDTDQLPFILDIPAAEQVPFPDQMKWKEEKIKRFIKRRYLPLSLIRSSHKGNILKALDLWRMKWCFVKQAKAWAAEDYSGRTMRDRLLWQMEVSQKTYKAVRTPGMLDFAEQDGYSYLITEYLDGKTLDHLILAKSNKPDAVYRLLEYYYEALYLVSFFHDAGYIHRDLTAKNIFICKGEVYLADLELAYPINSQPMPPYTSGSLGYMSPQQRRNEQPTVSEDVYSMSALLYYIVSGENPKALSMLSEGERESQLKQLDASNGLKQLLIGGLKDKPVERIGIPDLLQGIESYLIGYREQLALLWRKTRPKRIKQKLVVSAVLMILACLTVTVMWLVSDEPNSRPNGFDRIFVNDNLAPIDGILLPQDIRYLAGVVGDSAYFSRMIPGQVTVLHIPSGKIFNRHFLKEPQVLQRLNKSGILQVDRYGLSIFDGNAHLLILERPQTGVEIHRVPELFTRAVRFSANSIALRKFKSGERDQYLYRYDLSRDTALDESRVTEPAQDGGLVSGGMLEFDSRSDQGAYVTRYANHITLVDTNMHILRTGHTIDTFRHYILESRIVPGGKGAEITNGGPATHVNKAAAMEDGKLYVYSYAKADNETGAQFTNSNVIDVYRTTDLQYAGTYRLPAVDKQRIYNFKVIGSKMYVLYPGMLRIYPLPEPKETLKSAGL